MDNLNLFNELDSGSRTIARQYDAELREMMLSGLTRYDLTPNRNRVSPEKLTEQWIEFARSCKIVSGVDTVSFEPYEAQKLLFRLLEEHSGACVGKVRQFGMTEFYGNRFLFKACLNPAYKAVIFSLTGDDTSKIADRVRLMGNSNPDVVLEKANTQEVKVAGGGAIYFRTSTPESGRGLSSISEILFDEWGFLRDILARSIYGAVTPSMQMVGEDARISMVCTPPRQRTGQYMEVLGAGNGDRDFREITREMREGKIDPVQHWVDDSNWVKFLLHWRAHPEYSKDPNYLSTVKTQFKLDETTTQREFNLNYDVKDGSNLVQLNWFPRYSVQLSEYSKIIQSWDTAQTTGPASAKWGCVTAGIAHSERGMRIDLLHALTRKMNLHEGKGVVKAQAQAFNPNVVLIENKSSGIDLAPFLEADPEFYYPVLLLTPPKSSGAGDDAKARRFADEVYQLEAGSVWLPESAPWLMKLIAMLESAPLSDERDLMDAFSQLLRWIRLDLAKLVDEPQGEMGSAEPRGARFRRGGRR